MISRETSEILRVKEIVKRLKKEYSHAMQCKHKNSFHLLVATILSAQSTDRQVNRVLKKLFEKYKTPKDFGNAKLRELKKIVKGVGCYNRKARHIKEGSRVICKKYSGKVPDSMSELLKLPGVGRKTANIVLSHGFGKNKGIAVDTHAFRLSKRLGLSNAVSPEKVEMDLLKKIPKKHWGIINSLFVFHGRSVCTARKPKHKECILFDLCPSKGI